MTSTDRRYEQVFDAIVNSGLDGTAVLDLFTGFNGLQILTKEFVKYLSDEGLYVIGENEEEK